PVHVVHGRVDEVEDAGAEQHPHGADVVHQPRHQIPGAPLLIEREGHMREARYQIMPQVALDVAADVEDDGARSRAHDGLHQRDDTEHAERRREGGDRAAGGDPVDHRLQQPRHHHGERGPAEQAHDAPHQPSAVADEIGPQTGHRFVLATRVEPTQRIAALWTAGGWSHRARATARSDMPTGGPKYRSARSHGTSQSLMRAWKPGTDRRFSTRAFRYQPGTPTMLK